MSFSNRNKHQKGNPNMTTSSTTQANRTQITTRGTDFIMERIFDAPRELLFQVWSDPKHLQQWWGPKHWTLPVCKLDFRPGGTWHYGMLGPDGMESWGLATYHEIVAPERIVYTDAFSDAQGNVQEGMPLMVITVEFIDLGGKTKLRETTAFASVADLEQAVAMGMSEGATQMWDRLGEYVEQRSTLTLPSDREIRMARIFHAPRELVFKATTDPKMVSQWWGQSDYTTIVDAMDLRVGGKWRFVQRDPQGNEHAFRGEYREITPPSRVVQTFEYEGLPGSILVETLTLEDLGGGKTLVTTTSTFDSKEDRDGMLASGMEGGANESWDRLAALLEKQQA